MAFTDLPEHWAERPVHHPALVADVLDLLVPLSDRRAGAVLVALCDEQGRLLQPCLVRCEPGSADAAEAPPFFAEVLAELRPGGSMLLAVARPTGLSARPEDLAFAAAAAAACQGSGLRLLGVHVVTLDGSRPLPQAGPRAA
jgi:hypothetical protein